MFPPDLDKGNLREKYDVLVFNGGGFRPAVGGAAGAAVAQPAMPAARPAVRRQATCARARAAGAAAAAGAEGGGGGRGAAGRGGGRAGFTPEPIPDEYARRQGQVTAQTLAANQAVRAGGRHGHRDRRVRDGRRAAVRPAGDEPSDRERQPAAAREVLRAGFRAAGVALTTPIPLAHGLGKELDVFFDNDPVFKLGAGRRRRRAFAASPGSPTPRRCAAGGHGASSTWTRAWRWSRPRVGKGRLFLFGPEMLFRSQPHGSYKLFFNGLYLSVAPDMK